MQSKYARGTFPQEIARLQNILATDTTLKPYRRRQLQERLANRQARHNRNIQSAGQTYDYYLTMLQHFQNDGTFQQLDIRQQRFLQDVCFKHLRNALRCTNQQLIKYLRSHLNASIAVRKYKTRTAI